MHLDERPRPDEPELRVVKPLPPGAERTPTAPQGDEPRVPPATPLPSRPPVAQPPRVRAARPIEPTRMPPPAKAPQKKSSALGVTLIVLAFAVVLVGLIYLFRDRIFGSDDYTNKPEVQGSATAPPEPATAVKAEPATAVKPAETATKPAETAVKPAETATKPAETPSKPADPTAPPAAVVRAETAPGGAKVALTAPAAGQVAWIAEKGAAVDAGAPVAKFLGYAKWESKLKDGNERGGFYAKKLAEAQAKNDSAAADAAQKKVDEKKQMVEEAEKALEKLVVTTPSAGKVKPLVAVGADVKEGVQVAEVGGDADKPQTTLRASFDVGDGASQYGEGKPAVVALKSAPDKQYASVVEKVDAGQVVVKIVSAGGAVPAAGDEITLLPPKK